MEIFNRWAWTVQARGGGNRPDGGVVTRGQSLESVAFFCGGLPVVGVGTSPTAATGLTMM
eukprot:15166337-Alexandrium_andersonii.AAC.1